MTAPTLDHARGRRRHPALVVALLGVALVALSVVRLGVGETFHWKLDYTSWEFVVNARLERLMLALAAGAALAGAGVALQALLRNPLAEPFVLGLSSGAAVGKLGQVLLADKLRRQLGGGHIGALAGAALSMAIVYAAGRRRGTIDPLGLLLVGIALATINGAIIIAVNYFAGPYGLARDVSEWMMGRLNEGLEWPVVIGTSAAVVLGIAVIAVNVRAMDAASFSEGEAISLGVNIARLRAVLFTVSCVLAAAAVVLAGPVAFVGLICPHIGRLLLGPRHATLLPAAVILGAMLLLLSDMASVVCDAGQGRMPIGIFTAILGGPVFVAMLRPQLGRGLE